MHAVSNLDDQILNGAASLFCPLTNELVTAAIKEHAEEQESRSLVAIRKAMIAGN